MTMTARICPPATSELEISIFGPGVGECIVVHLGGGEWMVVDSCLGADAKTAVAIQYLQSLKVNLAEQVVLIVVTHWHDDHIRGMSQLVRACKSARFACSAALKTAEFLTLVAADKYIKFVEHSSGVSEFCDVLECLEERAKSKYSRGPAHWVSEGMVLHCDGDLGVEVRGLSPSALTVSDSKGEIARLTPKLDGAIRRFRHVAPNDLSVALIVNTPGISALLGADLECGKAPERGWRAVLASKVRPNVTSSVYKVAHHGSPNADLDDIWDRMTEANPFAVVTPYSRGKTPRPSDADVKRIKARPAIVHCTTWPAIWRPPRRRAADKTMNEVARTRRALSDRFGQVRYRVPLQGTSTAVSFELFGSAVQL